MISTGLKRIQTAALWGLAQSAGIPQAELFQILNQSGASGLLANCLEKGFLRLSKPARAETDFVRLLYQDYWTNNALFFTYTQRSPLLADIKNWRLSIEGDGVERPFSLNYDELLKLPLATLTRFLECAGNGRALYASLLGRKAEGVQWHLGGWGIAEWTGVPLAVLLEMAKIKKEAVEVMPVGMDNPPGRRPMPVAKAMADDTLLAYIMNGQILAPDHGFPLRALVSGWAGISSIKWVTKIIVSTRPIRVAANTSRYVLAGRTTRRNPPRGDR